MHKWLWSANRGYRSAIRYEHQGLFFLLFLLLLYRNTQRPNVSKYATIVSNGFLCALEACLDNLELP